MILAAGFLYSLLPSLRIIDSSLAITVAAFILRLLVIVRPSEDD